VTARSAGILLFRQAAAGPEVLLVHPGGPFWARRDLGAWSIPKGEHDEDETAEQAARREFAEETGQKLVGELVPLGSIRQKAGKLVEAFAVEGDFDVGSLRSAIFEMEWPPRSGRRQAFPEVDRAAWFPLAEAAERMIPGQIPFLDRLAAYLVTRL
jgi:predicted NUDIX family NTP pyrophosphohydrolase